MWSSVDAPLAVLQPDERSRGVAAALSWINRDGEGWFQPDRPVWIARAPGRLDVMGGFGDYSGSRVLEFPIAQGTWIAAQALDQALVVVRSAQVTQRGDDPVVEIPLAALTPPDGPLAFGRARALFTAHPGSAWAAYVVGALVVLQHSFGRRLQTGLRVVIHSEVPVGKGLSSSAALEVAALELFAHRMGVAVDERQAALMAQQVENLIVGAPCGVMDQMTSLSGKLDHLSEIVCQPAELIANLPLPPDLQLWGIDSGLRHAITGADYGSVRTAAFMGYRIVADVAGLKTTIAGDGRAHVHDPLFGGYLANVSPALWHARFRSHLPERLEGRMFLSRYAGITDEVTHVEPSRTYAVRACAEHPILENQRVSRFRDILAAGAGSEAARQELGALMAAAHASYTACELGSPGTDHIVKLVTAAGTAAGLYGAKITGGGSGGMVVVLARRGADAVVHEIARTYAADSGHETSVITGSSSGARFFGVHQLSPG